MNAVRRHRDAIAALGREEWPEEEACSHGNLGARTSACGEIAVRVVDGNPYCEHHAASADELIRMGARR